MSLNNTQSINLIKKGSSLIISFNRVNKLNAIDLHMRDIIWEGLMLVQSDVQINALIFTSETPGSFSAGADINAKGFYLSLKGQIESDIIKIGIMNISV